MDQPKDKSLSIYLSIAFVVGALIGACLVLLLFPTEECLCESEELVKGTSETMETDVVLEETPHEEEITTSAQSVSLPVSQCDVVVDIAGAVHSPGVYCLKQGSNIVDAVNQAKGFIEGVAHKYVSMRMNLSLNLTNHQKIYIPFEEDTYCEIKGLEYVKEAEKPVTTGNSEEEETDDTVSCIDINTATKTQLMELNGVGESTAQKIIDARPFSETIDILDVSGIGEATYEKFKDDLCVF